MLKDGYLLMEKKKGEISLSLGEKEKKGENYFTLGVNTEKKE